MIPYIFPKHVWSVFVHVLHNFLWILYAQQLTTLVDMSLLLLKLKSWSFWSNLFNFTLTERLKIYHYLTRHESCQKVLCVGFRTATSLRCLWRWTKTLKYLGTCTSVEIQLCRATVLVVKRGRQKRQNRRTISFLLWGIIAFFATLAKRSLSST